MISSVPLGKIAALLANGITEQRKAIDRELERLGQEMRDEFSAADERLRGELKHILGGSTTRRMVGVWLVAGGIAFGFAGSVMGDLVDHARIGTTSQRVGVARSGRTLHAAAPGQSARHPPGHG